MREEERSLFPLSTIGNVVHLFRLELTDDHHDPDIVLLSIVAGCIENSLTSPRTGTVSEDGNLLCASVTDFEEPEVAEVENLRIEPPVELHIVEALYAKFEAVVRGYCDLSLFKEEGRKGASRALIKRVSDIIWNTLTKSQYKDRAHLQSIYSYLTGSKLDCFGVAMAVVAGCQVLGFQDVHLALSEDHAWVVFGESGSDTAEVTWHGRGNEDKRGLPVDLERIRDSWLYVGGHPVVCSRHMEVAALVSGINPAITPVMDSLEVGVLQQELLWLLYDLGHLDRYPMALGNLGDLEEISGSTGRPASQELYDEAVEVARRDYGDQHVYPYTYLAGFHYRQRDFKAALRAWADAASVIKRYKYSKDDEEIYKEFMEINNELIPHILKADENLVSDPECFGHLVRFYDGLCSWEEESSTPVLHIGWVKPIVKCFTAFDYHVRAKLDIARVEDHDQGKSALLALSDLGLATIPDRLNNNYKDSVEDCDIRECDKESGHYDMKILKEEEKSIYLPTNPDHPSARVSHVRCEDFEKMHVNRLLRLASLPHSDVAHSEDPKKHGMLISHMIEHAGEKLFNVKFLLGNCISMDEAFLEPASPSFPTLTKSKAIDSTFLAEASSSRPAGGKASHLRTTSSSTAASATKTSKTLKKTSSNRDGRVKVSVYSSKIGDIKPLLLCEKLNSSALHLHLTAQSQTEVKKSRNSSFEADFAIGTAGGRVKRQRRE